MPKTTLPATAVRPDDIDRKRQTYLAVIQQTRALESGPHTLLDKANSLLTLHWAHASWKSRATILNTVDWLLQVAINNPAPVRRPRPRLLATMRDLRG